MKKIIVNAIWGFVIFAAILVPYYGLWDVAPVVHAQPAAVGIVMVAPTQCEIGELVCFDASGSDVDDLEWEIRPKTPDFKVVDRRAFFSGRKTGKYLVIVAGAKEGQAFLQSNDIIVDPNAEPVPETVEPDDDAPPVEREWRELVDTLERLDA